MNGRIILAILLFTTCIYFGCSTVPESLPEVQALCSDIVHYTQRIQLAYTDSSFSKSKARDFQVNLFLIQQNILYWYRELGEPE